MIAVDDIGWFGARAFTDAAGLNRREIDLAGDVRTMPEAAEILTEALGPVDCVRADAHRTGPAVQQGRALMLEWFDRVGYSADIAGLEREFGRSLTKLPNGPSGTREPPERNGRPCRSASTVSPAAFDEHSRAVDPAEAVRQLIQQVERADEVGVTSSDWVNITAGSSSTLPPP